MRYLHNKFDGRSCVRQITKLSNVVNVCLQVILVKITEGRFNLNICRELNNGKLQKERNTMHTDQYFQQHCQTVCGLWVRAEHDIV